jgi:hypothetical protein
MQHESIKLKRPKRRSTRKPGKGRANAAMLLLLFFFFFHPLFARRCDTQNKQETAHIRQCYVLRRPRYTQDTPQIAAKPDETYRKNTTMKNLKKTHQTYYFIYKFFYCKIAAEAQAKQTNLL